jgi:methyl-accepting chemotaxis protein
MRAQLGHLNQQNNASSASVAEILAGVTSLASRIESQASAVAQASAAMEEMSASIDSVAKIADRKRAAADELQRITRSGGQKVEELNGLVTDISRQVDDIAEMIRLINSIASQTNLLSMNASIEAAHAGDYGKGFAVVADEIRRLAESTAANSKRITVTLKEIIGKIQGSLEASTESSAAFTRLDGEVTEVVGAFTEIAGSTQELANGGKEILQASGSLLQITEEIRSGSAEMKQGAEDINRALVEITHISAESKQAVDDVATRSAEISTAIDEIAVLSQEDRDVGARLNQEVRRFRSDGEAAAPSPDALAAPHAPAHAR